MDDPRSDELLEEHGRIAARLGLAFAWTDGLEGSAAKACSRGGSANWKRAQRLPQDEDTAGAYFRERARKRNPAVVASRSGLVLVESDDGDLDDLCKRHGLERLPRSVRVRSRRGQHTYGRPPKGYEGPLKIQLSPDGIAAAADGYLIGAGALHETRRIYRYEEHPNAVADFPLEWLERAARLGSEARAKARGAAETGEPIPTGQRNDAIFHLALELVRAGKARAEILERLLWLNREQCKPPLPADLVEKQLDGARKWARTHPRFEDELRERAQRTLRRKAQDDKNERPRDALGWEDPVPMAARGAAARLDGGLLPEWLALWASEITREKGAALDLGATLALGVVSGGIARHVQVSPRPGWWEPTNMYVIVALPPGQTKSPVFKAALRPVRALERELMRRWDENARLVAISSAIFDKRRKELVSEASSDEELEPDRLRAMMDQLDAGLGETESQPQPRLLTEDVTPEGLASLLAAHGRIIAASDEGSALFENLAGRYARGSVSWDLFNKAHSGIDVAIDRKGSGAVIVFDPALTLVLATQPEMLRTLSGKPGAGGRGVLARPLYVLPDPIYTSGPTPAAESDVLAEYERRIRDVYSDTPELETAEDGHPRPTTLTFDSAARELFERFEDEINGERLELSGDDIAGESVYLGWLSKLAGQTARIAAVLHCATRWTGGFGTNALVIDEATVERAIALARYFRSHALGVFGLMGELPMQALAATILNWIAVRSADELTPLTVRDVHRSRGKGTTATQVRAALRLLEEHGYVWLERLPAGRTGGRPSERVHVNPQLWNVPNQSDRPDETSVLSGVSGDFEDISRCTEHPRAAVWLARDGVWRCRGCDPPAFPAEVLEERRP